MISDNYECFCRDRLFWYSVNFQRNRSRKITEVSHTKTSHKFELGIWIPYMCAFLLQSGALWYVGLGYLCNMYIPPQENTSQQIVCIFHGIHCILCVTPSDDFLDGRCCGRRLSRYRYTIHPINTLRPRQNGRHFADDVFKCIFLNENVWISLKISLKFVPKGLINNIPSLVQIRAWRRPSDKLLSEPMMVSLLTHICVTRPQWVKYAQCLIVSCSVVVLKVLFIGSYFAHASLLFNWRQDIKIARGSVFTF